MRAGRISDETVFVSCWPAAGGASQGQYLLGLVSISQASQFDVVRERIKQTLDAVTSDVGATYDLDYTFSNPPLVNDADVVRELVPVIQDVVGPEQTWTFQASYPVCSRGFCAVSGASARCVALVGYC